MHYRHVDRWDQWLQQDTNDFGGRKPDKIYADHVTRSSPNPVPTIFLGEDNCWNREEWILDALRDNYGHVPFAFGTIEEQGDGTDGDEILMSMDDFHAYWHTNKDRNPL